MVESSNPVPSPCVRNCCLDDKDICLGCLRSIDEILQWSAATNEVRLQILHACEDRKSSKASPHSI